MRLFYGVLVLFSGPIMSLISRTWPGEYGLLPIHNPGFPEHYVCDPDFGRNIVPLDCQMAVEANWPKGTTPVHYYFRDPSASNSIRLPVSDHEGSCTVSIESAGPGRETPWENAERQNYFSISPNELRGVAGYLIQECAEEGSGIGGFITLRFSASGRWMESLANSVTEWTPNNGTDGRPNDGTFLTISITNPSGFEFRPGDTDPAVAATLSNLAYNLSVEYPEYERPARKSYFEEMALELRYKSEYMKRGNSAGPTWWAGLDDGDDDDEDGRSLGTGEEFGSDIADDGGSGNGESEASSPGGDGKTQGGASGGEGHKQNAANATLLTSEMTYQCDAHLGAPSATDCEHLAWSGLKPATSIETLQPHIPNIYTQGTCALGISSSTAMTISWAHLLAAFETLNNLCVQNPIRSVQGGRAFHGVQGLKGWINGKKRSLFGKRGGEVDVRGNDALPEGINATVWRHDGGNGKAILECEWMKAMAEGDLGSCRGD